MINLIPPHAKRKVLVEYWIRVLSVWLVIWSFVLMLGAGVLLPVYVLIGSQITLKEQLVATASVKVMDYENSSVTLVKASQQAKYALDEISLPLFTDYITLFEDLKGSSIKINSLSLSRSKEGIKPITVSGVALDRQSLASFRDRIVAEEEVDSVDLPISNLAQDKDIPFNITVTLKNNPDV